MNNFTVIALQDPPTIPRAWSVFAALSQFLSAPMAPAVRVSCMLCFALWDKKK